ncbi:uncharacterized protein LOC129803143 isoform X1 [Phlebotomus papatasi]|uniref:uncharacterized protein LOC129803143 isoform X1 n=1 Tax=Phlebotomus papatasi TaxID=29031 RepID=UPI00248363DB|nr:uncharacterized protein LOC129803143 isoform X1 [Phlebotomus papatasi]
MVQGVESGARRQLLQWITLSQCPVVFSVSFVTGHGHWRAGSWMGWPGLKSSNTGSKVRFLLYRLLSCFNFFFFSFQVTGHGHWRAGSWMGWSGLKSSNTGSKVDGHGHWPAGSWMGWPGPWITVSWIVDRDFRVS